MKAGFLLRFFASLLDLLIIAAFELCVLFPLSFVDRNIMGWFHISYEQKMQIVQIARFPIGAVLIAIPWLYNALFESSHRQATYGKFIFDIWVTGMKGERISFARATARFFCKILSTVPLFAGFFFCLFTKKSQALHDLICGTLVSVSGTVIEGTKPEEKEYF